MQFFPAVDAGPGYSFPGNSRGGFQETMTSQDFSGLLSKELEDPGEFATEPESGPRDGAAAVGPEPRAREDAAWECEESPARADESEAVSGRREVPEKGAHDAPQGREVQAKAAGRDGQAPEKGADDAMVRSELAGDALPLTEDGAVAGEAAEVQAAHLEAAVAGLARASATRASANPEVAARIEALHELMRQFRESPPAERRELAVALGARIKALRAEMEGQSSGSTPADAEPVMVGAKGFQSGHAHPSIRAVGREALGGIAARRSGVVSTTAGAESPGDVRSGLKSAESAMAADMVSTPAVPEAKVPGAGSGVVVEEKNSGARHAVAGEESTGSPAAPSKAADLLQNSGKAAGVAHGSVQEDLSGAPLREGGKVMDADQGRAVREKADPAGLETVRKSVREGASTEAVKIAAAPAATVSGEGRKMVEKVQADQIPTGKPQEGDALPRAGAPSAQSGGDRGRHDARDGFFSPRTQDSTTSARAASSTSGKIVLETEPQPLGVGQGAQAPIGQRLEASLGARSAEVYRQVEGGAFRNLGQGVRQLVIRLDPADLGQVSVILRVKGKEVQAVLRASSQETSQILGEQVAQLRSQLEAQGLKVGKLEVQTQLADSQSQSQWQGAEQHNRYQENRELAMSAQRWRTLERMDSGLVRDVQNTPQREKLSSGGLDIFA
jgi:flagellar hook-length control protein FliK